MDVDGAPSGWRPVLAYAGLSAANQMLWLTFTALTTDAARRYAVSSGAIGWLAEIFPLMYVALAVPTGALIDRRMPLWLAAVAAAALCAMLRRPGAYSTPAAVQARLREVWADPYIRRLTGLACVGFGVFIALTTWLQTLLEPAGVSDSAAGYLLLAMVVTGVLGSALLPAPIARRSRELAFVLASVAGDVPACWSSRQRRGCGPRTPSSSSSACSCSPICR